MRNLMWVTHFYHELLGGGTLILNRCRLTGWIHLMKIGSPLLLYGSMQQIGKITKALCLSIQVCNSSILSHATSLHEKFQADLEDLEFGL